MNTWRLARTAASILLTGSLVVACGGDEQPAVCDDVDALRTSLGSLQAFNVYDTNVLSDLSVVLDQIRTQVQQLGEDASSEYADEVDVVQAATDDLEVSVRTAVGAPTRANLSALSDDVQSFTAAFKALRTAVGDTC